MIEGLRSLPWLQERIRNDRSTVDTLIDCDKCMANNPVQIRQAMGCGFEPLIPGARAWMHEGYTDEPPTTCPGYTTKLPEVIEIAAVRLYAKLGLANDFCDGERVNEHVLAGLRYLEAADGEAMCWRPEEPK